MLLLIPNYAWEPLQDGFYFSLIIKKWVFFKIVDLRERGRGRGERERDLFYQPPVDSCVCPTGDQTHIPSALGGCSNQLYYLTGALF